MRFIDLLRIRRKPLDVLQFRIRIKFESDYDEKRAWELLNRRSGDNDLSVRLVRIAKVSVLARKRVDVSFHRGSIEVLILLEGLRIGYEVISEYKDFRESADLLLGDLENEISQYCVDNDFEPVTASGKIAGMPLGGPLLNHRGLPGKIVNFLMITQIGMFVVAGLAIWTDEKAWPGVLHESMTFPYLGPEVPMTHGFVIFLAAWGIGILTAFVLLMLLVIVVVIPEL
jgi:hypothetical protein